MIWENMYRDDGVAAVKSWLLVILLFLSCVVFVTPIALIDNLEPLVNAISKKLGSSSLIAVML
jgi:hypothetical protein